MTTTLIQVCCLTLDFTGPLPSSLKVSFCPESQRALLATNIPLHFDTFQTKWSHCVVDEIHGHHR